MSRPCETEIERRRRLAVASIARLGLHLSLRSLERDVLKLSQGYLSRLRKGNTNPSAALVALLVLLAREPQLVEAVGRLWRHTSKEPRP